MKRITAFLLTLCLLLSMMPSAFAQNIPNEIEIIPDVTDYTYTVTPILAPFAYYLYVQTDNPDPTSFRLVDKTCQYYTEDSYGEIRVRTSETGYSVKEVDPGTYYISQYLYKDVAFEDEATFRVPGGYIFRADASYSDGGEFVLLQKTYSGEKITEDRFRETTVRIPCSRLYTRNDYLMTNCYTEDMTFFEKLDAVQAYLNQVSVYPRYVFDTDRPNEERPYPFRATSVYAELPLDDRYAMYEKYLDGILAKDAFPFVLDSASFPGTMGVIAETLEPECETGSGKNHWEVTVTFNGETKTYGGAGAGGNDPLYTNRIKKDFTFQGESDLFATGTLDSYYTLLMSYDPIAVADAEVYRDLVTGDTFRQTIGATGGTWMRVAVEGYFGYGTSFAYGIPYGDHTDIMTNAWVDGRYIGQHERVLLGKTFEDHPTANIVLQDVSYVDHWGEAHTQDVCYYYNIHKDQWEAWWYYTNDSYYNASWGLPDELVLTREEVEAMDLDYNTNFWPTEGLVYDGTEYPGTPFRHKTASKVIIPETMTLYIDEKKQVSISVEPEDAFDDTVTLFSSDPSVVEIPNSLHGDWIQGVSEGTAIITAVARDGGASATCVVTVTVHPCINGHTYAATVETMPTTDFAGKVRSVCTICGDEVTNYLPSLLYTSSYDIREIKAATCEEAGETEYTWKETAYGVVCFRVVVPPLSHKYYVIVTPATCTEPGYSTYTCSRCGHTYEGAFTEATGHNYETKVVPPTCTGDGYTAHTCKNCGDQYTTDPVPALGHSFGDWVTMQQPTCTRDGWARRTCETCGQYENKTLPATDHTYESVTTPPTCTEEGYITLTCTGCGFYYRKHGDKALGHDYETTIEEIPTYEEWGVVYAKCLRCGADGRWGLPRLKLLEEYDYREVTKATCQTRGQWEYTWKNTDLGVISFIVTEDYGYHDYVPVVMPPTCTKEGYTTYTCSVCGDSYADDYIDPIAHSYTSVVTDPTCGRQGYTTHTCTVCGYSYADSYTSASCPGANFTDMPAPDHWSHSSIDWAVENGITTGATATTFNPNGSCTRGQIVTFLWRAAGKPEPTLRENPFTDVEEDDFYYKAVLWAVEEGITTGATATTFNPNGSCTRAQVVTFMWRTMGEPAPETVENPFEDVSADKYYRDAVLWAVENGITNGMSATKFAPNSTCTRAQIVTFLYRGFGK